MLRSYKLATNGVSVNFYDSDFDHIVNFSGHGYKHAKACDLWFDGETREEVTDLYLIRLLERWCDDSNPNCYRNLKYEIYSPEKLMKDKNRDFLKKIESELKSVDYMSTFPGIKKIIVNDKTTIVLWWDGTKTIVRPSANDNYDLEAAVCAAIAKKIYGTNSAFKRMIKEKTVIQENKKNEENNQFLKTLRDFLNCTKPSFSTYLGSVSTKGEEE